MIPISYKKLLAAKREFNPLLKSTPQDLSAEQVFGRLSPYLADPSVLQSMSPSALVPELMSIVQIEGDESLKPLLPKVIRYYRDAYSRSKEECSVACLQHDASVVKAINDYFSQGILEIDKTSLPIDELRYEGFRNVGAICEGCILPLLRDLLHQVRISRGSRSAESRIESADFGAVVAEMARDTDLGSLLSPQPWGIGLNQWRNIAQHHDTRTTGDTIIASYRTGRTKKEIVLDRKSLFELLIRVQRTYLLLKTARGLFLIGSPIEPPAGFQVPDVKTESLVFYLASMLASQGFELTDLILTEDRVRADVTDRTSMEPRGRMAHSMQFVRAVWLLFPRSRVAVVYRDVNEKPLVVLEADGDDCAKANSEQELGILLQKVRISKPTSPDKREST